MSEELVPQNPELPPAKRRNKKRTIQNPNQNTGHWNDQEHKTYLEFLHAHKVIMESQDQKKTSKIFKLMSEMIGTRSPSQCRSHHQKFNPYSHQIKKRQKGAGRKKKESNQDPQNEQQPQFVYQQYYPYQQNYVLKSDFQQNFMVLPIQFAYQPIENDDQVPCVIYPPPQDFNFFQNVNFNFNYHYQPNDVNYNEKEGYNEDQ